MRADFANDRQYALEAARSIAHAVPLVRKQSLSWDPGQGVAVALLTLWLVGEAVLLAWLVWGRNG